MSVLSGSVKLAKRLTALIAPLTLMVCADSWADNVPFHSKFLDVCYTRINTDTFTGVTVRLLEMQCTPIGKFSKGDHRFERMSILFSKMKPGAIDLDMFRVKFSLSDKSHLYLTRDGGILYREKSYVIDQNSVMEIEAMLRPIYDAQFEEAYRKMMASEAKKN